MANEKVNKFVEILKRDNEKIKDERAVRIGQSVKEAQIRLILDKRSKIRGMEDNLAAMTDLSASNDAMDVNAIKDIDAADFVARYQKLSETLFIERQKYELAVKIGSELFGIDMEKLTE